MSSSPPQMKPGTPSGRWCPGRDDASPSRRSGGATARASRALDGENGPTPRSSINSCASLAARSWSAPVPSLLPARSGSAANLERQRGPYRNSCRARSYRGPIVSVLSVAGFLLVWFIAAEIAQSRMLPGPVEVLSYLRQGGRARRSCTELGITLWRVGVVLRGHGHRQRHRQLPWASAARPGARSASIVLSTCPPSSSSFSLMSGSA